MNTSAEVDEQQREKAAREQVMIHELKEAPLVYEWSVRAPPFFAQAMVAVIMSVIASGISLVMSIYSGSMLPFFLGTVLGIAYGFFVRYLWLSDKHYHYQLTPIGIRYTIQDAIPETAYQVVRAFAWVGVFVCILAVGVLGPLALVGAGGMAFLAFGMTNFSSEIREDETYFSDTYEVRVLRSSNVFSIESEPFSLTHYGQFFCEKDKLDETLNRILPYLKNYTIKEIKSYRDL